jgi:ribosomal protein S14
VRLPKDAFQPTMVATAEDNRGKYGVQSSSRIYKCSVPSMIEEARSAGVAKRSDHRTLGYYFHGTRKAAERFFARYGDRQEREELSVLSGKRKQRHRRKSLVYGRGGGGGEYLELDEFAWCRTNFRHWASRGSLTAKARALRQDERSGRARGDYRNARPQATLATMSGTRGGRRVVGLSRPHAGSEERQALPLRADLQESRRRGGSFPRTSAFATDRPADCAKRVREEVDSCWHYYDEKSAAFSATSSVRSAIPACG